MHLRSRGKEVRREETGGGRAVVGSPFFPPAEKEIEEPAPQEEPLNLSGLPWSGGRTQGKLYILSITVGKLYVSWFYKIRNLGRTEAFIFKPKWV